MLRVVDAKSCEKYLELSMLRVVDAKSCENYLEL
jgi:hypothetical protein